MPFNFLIAMWLGGFVIFWHIHCTVMFQTDEFEGLAPNLLSIKKTNVMEIKKTNHASLEKKRNTFLIVGVVTALSFTLMAFEYSWEKAVTVSPIPELYIDLMESEIAPISVPKVEKPVVSVKQKLSNVFKIVEELDPTVPADLVKEPDFTDFEPVFAPFDIPFEEVVENKVFTIVEEMPSFPGGDDALFRYIGKNIDYPQMAVDAGITGKVYVTFVVNKKGEIEDLKLLKGIGGGCDEEALRVLSSMPLWKPGLQRGKAVNVQYNIPIQFSLK
jgi:protein TonB